MWRVCHVKKNLPTQFHCFLWVDKITLWIFGYLVLNMTPISFESAMLCSNNSKRLQQFVLISEPAKYGVIYSQKVTICCRCCRQSWLYWDFRRFDSIALILLLIFSDKNWNTCAEMPSKAPPWQLISPLFSANFNIDPVRPSPKRVCESSLPNSSCRTLHSLSSKSNSPFLNFSSGSHIMLSKDLFP